MTDRLALRVREHDDETTSILESMTFVGGVARYHDLVYLLSKKTELVERDVAHTNVVGVYRSEWTSAIAVGWDSAAAAVAKHPEERLVVVGEDGQVCVYIRGGSLTEQLEPAPRMIRRAKTIDGRVYACGMGRQVYRRVDANSWVAMNAPTPETHERVGFEAIDGFSADDLYAVGWGGEIWHYDGTGWNSAPKLTDLILTSVSCAGDGVVYVVGQEGQLIRGRADTWEIVTPAPAVRSDIWDVHWFDGRLYLTTMTDLYTLDEGDTLQRVEFDHPAPIGFHRLTAADGVLWSIGSRAVLSFDGKEWVKHA